MLRGFVEPERGVDGGDRGVELGVHGPVRRELPVEPGRPLVEQLARGDRPPSRFVRIREREDADQEIFDRGELARFACGLPPLPEGDAETDGERSAGGRDRGDPHPVAAHELDRALDPIPAARGDRPALEVPAEVFGERLRRGVAPLRLDGERSRDDAIEVAAQLPPQRWRRGGAEWREHRRDRRPDFAARRATAGEQLVEQEPERVDVGSRGLGCALELLRGGVLRRQHAGRAGERSLLAVRRQAAWRCRSPAASRRLRR